MHGQSLIKQAANAFGAFITLAGHIRRRDRTRWRCCGTSCSTRPGESFRLELGPTWPSAMTEPLTGCSRTGNLPLARTRHCTFSPAVQPGSRWWWDLRSRRSSRIQTGTARLMSSECRPALATRPTSSRLFISLRTQTLAYSCISMMGPVRLQTQQLSEVPWARWPAVRFGKPLRADIERQTLDLRELIDGQGLLRWKRETKNRVNTGCPPRRGPRPHSELNHPARVRG